MDRRAPQRPRRRPHRPRPHRVPVRAYHGGPYATLVLLPEVTGLEVRVAKVPAAAMRTRLGEAMAASRLRAREVFGDETGVLGGAMARSFADFVALAERKEAETGEPVTVTASL